ncbi:ubiquitin-specific protease ubp1, partial [Pleosporales sp. CAS-2024a]
MSKLRHDAFDRLDRWEAAPASGTSLTWLLLTTVCGAYGLVKALDLAGFPCSLWIAHMLDMSVGRLRSSLAAAGGLLGSVLGSHGESLLQTGLTRFTSALSSGPSTTPPGLGNVSNSCYQNSVIQGLAALPSLRNYLSVMTSQHSSLTSDSTHGALYDLIKELNDPANVGKHFWIRGKLKSMSTFTQQDAQEYFSKILDDMDTEAKKASSNMRRCSVSLLEATKVSHHPSSMQSTPLVVGHGHVLAPQSTLLQDKVTPNPLDGLIAQRVGCTACGYSGGLSLINFNCITVSLGTHQNYDIRDCLDEYTKLEYIDGVECPKCTLLKLQKTLTPLATPGSPFETKLRLVSDMLDEEKFDDNTLVKALNIPKKNWVQSSKSKQIVIARAPKSLVLHVNRSNFDEVTGASYKNTASVSYPRLLDLGHWCLGNASDSSQPHARAFEEWPRDPTQSMLLSTDSAMASSPALQYKLQAAVTHFGSHGNGHYVCYRPHTRIAMQSDPLLPDDQQNTHSEQWWRFSDDTVYAVPEEQAHQANVFMLFYEQIDMASNTVSADADSMAVLLHIAQDAPLPPEQAPVIDSLVLDYNIAVTIPLPDDDASDNLGLLDPAVPGHLKNSSPSTKGNKSLRVNSTSNLSFRVSRNGSVESTNAQRDTEVSETVSEDVGSTQATSGSDARAFSSLTTNS